MEGSQEYKDYTMEYPDVLGKFSNFSSSFYIYSAALVILIDAIVMLLMVHKNFSRSGFQVNRVMLFSLALCDVLYEAATTVLYLRSNRCAIVEDCKTLYRIYQALSLCTALHIMIEVTGKAIHSAFAFSVFWSACAWLVAIVITFIHVTDGDDFMDGRSMLFLGRFKAFGNVLFGAILISGLGLLCLLKISTLRTQKGKGVFEIHEPRNVTQEPRNVTPNSRNASADNILISSIFLACTVGWYAWVVIAVDSNILMVIEIMKCFEIIRLGARVVNPLILFHWAPNHNEDVHGP